jgi:hypothetical protein
LEDDAFVVPDIGVVLSLKILKMNVSSVGIGPYDDLLS